MILSGSCQDPHIASIVATNFPFQKLVTAEEILRMTKNATPLKNVTYDTVLDAVRKMAQVSFVGPEAVPKITVILTVV